MRAGSEQPVSFSREGSILTRTRSEAKSLENSRTRHSSIYGEMATGDVVGRRSATVKAKVVLLGEGAVGKTSIVLRYSENKFNDKHVQTLQVLYLEFRGACQAATL